MSDGYSTGGEYPMLPTVEKAAGDSTMGGARYVSGPDPDDAVARCACGGILGFRVGPGDPYTAVAACGLCGRRWVDYGDMVLEPE